MTDHETTVALVHGQARAAWRAGLNVVAPREDGTKRPDLPAWTEYRTRRVDLTLLKRWYPGRTGLGVICGSLSDDPDPAIRVLEAIEAFDFDVQADYLAFLEAADATGLRGLVDRIEAGYCDTTPGDEFRGTGVRWLVRCTATGGSEKLARRPATPEELARDPDDKIKTLIETKGIGGYAILAPTNGRVHPTGGAYVRRSGDFAVIATITSEERAALVSLLRTFDQMPLPAPQEASLPRAANGERPGDAFNARATWPQVLEPHGWVRVFERGDTVHWRRPGKAFGTSATTNHQGSDLLWVFSSSTAFEPERSYTKFAAYALLCHGGDYRAAARALAAEGYGAPIEKVREPKAVRATVGPSHATTEPLTSVYDFGGGHFESSHRGVFFVGTDKDGDPLPPQWICSPLAVVAKTRDAKGAEWGRLLQWRDADGVLHHWAMPMELLQGDGSDVRRELARLGLEIAPSRAARERLNAFLNVWPVEGRARCVDRLGWHGVVYVTPSACIGSDGETVVFQNAHAIEPAFSTLGTVEQWRDEVAGRAAGNSRLLFSTSVAFAGPLPSLVGEESGGFHLRGASSSGKTTALQVAASVWGRPADYLRLWRATANGLEGLAALHNDGVLILDELSQIDPREAGEAAYLLANGQGKARASRSGTARQSARWRLCFLSAGEESLVALMQKAGRRASVGQEIRLADVDAEAGAGLGLFEDLHDHASPAAFALALRDGATSYHGTVGQEWLHRLVADRGALPDRIHAGVQQFVTHALPEGAEGQVVRVARRFALVAVAGELATGYGLTGWPEEEASRAVARCFAVWLEGFGGAGNREDRTILAQVRGFFEAHGASRFESMEGGDGQRVPNRAGFVRAEAGQREYCVLPEAYRREICAGQHPSRVTKLLLAHGWLEPDTDRKATQKPRLPGLGPTRCYVFTSKMWEDECD